jgi:hypothetical protein
MLLDYTIASNMNKRKSRSMILLRVKWLNASCSSAPSEINLNLIISYVSTLLTGIIFFKKKSGDY